MFDDCDLLFEKGRMKLSTSLCLFFCFAKNASAQVYSGKTGDQINTTWLETGFARVGSEKWITLSTYGSDFVDPIILISLPEIRGNSHTEGRPTAVRLNNIVVSGGRVTFETKMFVPNDTFCATPASYLAPLQVAWMVVEKGVYIVNGSKFIVWSGEVTRTNGVLDTNQRIVLDYPKNCLPNPSNASDTDCQYYVPIADLGAVATIQSLVYNTYLFLRIEVVRKKNLKMVLTPHDSNDPSYFNFSIPETAGFLVFRTGLRINCEERMAFETRVFYPVSSDVVNYDFTFSYLYPPGVFGLLVSQVSFTDATSLRVFNRTSDGAKIITQEDQCASPQTEHTALETAGLFIVGELRNQSDFLCRVRFNSPDEPTSEPTSLPTVSPTSNPTVTPTSSPTAMPSATPTAAPSSSPTASPTLAPSGGPTLQPTASPTATPTAVPTAAPTSAPTAAPTTTPTFPPTASPTSAPTAAPTTTPTFPPTASPTSAPTAAPTTTPTFPPTATPTASPTSTPTFAPTSAPTFGPTLQPSSSPSLAPTYADVVCFDFVAWDMFGDGWDNQEFSVTHLTTPAQSTAYDVTCNCRHITQCFDNIDDANANFTIAKKDPYDNVKHAWESYFTYVDWDGTIHVGNMDSTLQMWGGNVTCLNCVDYSQDSVDNQCDRCKHPPPKAKSVAKPAPSKSTNNTYRMLSETVEEMSIASFSTTGNGTSAGPAPAPNAGMTSQPKPKRPPLEFPFVLFDETVSNQGWYDSSGDVMEMCGLPTPKILSYPRYYITNADRTELIHSGTICGPFSPEKCQEVLPYDGKFVWRVAGYDSNPDDISWHFCTINGGLGQELSFTMKNGKCIPNDLIDSSAYCSGIVTLAFFSGRLLVRVQTASDELSIAETKTLENKISKNMFYNSPVTINSYERMGDGTGFLVSFSATVRVEDTSKYDGTVSSELEQFKDSMFEHSTNVVSGGTLFVSLQSAVTADPTLEGGQLSSMSSLSLLSLDMTGYKYETLEGELDKPHVDEVTTQQIESDSSLSWAGYASVGLGFLVVVAATVGVVVARGWGSPSYGVVVSSADSEHGATSEIESGDACGDLRMDYSETSLIDSSVRSNVGRSMHSKDDMFRFSFKSTGI